MHEQWLGINLGQPLKVRQKLLTDGVNVQTEALEAYVKEVQ